MPRAQRAAQSLTIARKAPTLSCAMAGKNRCDGHRLQRAEHCGYISRMRFPLRWRRYGGRPASLQARICTPLRGVPLAKKSKADHSSSSICVAQGLDCNRLAIENKYSTRDAIRGATPPTASHSSEKLQLLRERIEKSFSDGKR